MARLFAGLCMVGLCGLLTSPLPACSLCTSPLRRETLGAELDRADLVLFGYAANPKLNVQAGALPGAGSTDFTIERIVKSDGNLNQKKLTLERYVPVLDPKDPPRFLLFCNMNAKAAGAKLDPFLGRQTKSAAVVDYLEHARAERARGKAAALLYYAKFLDHPDDVIAEDAFLEYARSTDQDVGQVAKQLDPAQLRGLLQRPRLDPDRISLFAFLLGNCGEPKDADFLRQRITESKGDDLRSLDGLLGGYLAMRPHEGWKLTQDILHDRAAGFLKKYAALRAVRLYMGWKPAETKASMLVTYRLVVADGETADLAIEDLRRWKIWDLTTLILAQYRKASHDAPIVKRGILRYALCCPFPEAHQFLDRARAQEPALVKDLTDSLEFERKD
jgi:hypothetical protein